MPEEVKSIFKEREEAKDLRILKLRKLFRSLIITQHSIAEIFRIRCSCSPQVAKSKKTFYHIS